MIVLVEAPEYECNLVTLDPRMCSLVNRLRAPGTVLYTEFTTVYSLFYTLYRGCTDLLLFFQVALAALQVLVESVYS